MILSLSAGKIGAVGRKNDRIGKRLHLDKDKMVYRMLYRQYYHPRTAWRRTAFSRYKILQQDYWRNPFSALFLGGKKTLFYA